MDQKLVKKQIKVSSFAELEAWKEHALKCRAYYLKYPNEYEVKECDFVISHINQRLGEMENEEIE